MEFLLFNISLCQWIWNRNEMHTSCAHPAGDRTQHGEWVTCKGGILSPLAYPYSTHRYQQIQLHSESLSLRCYCIYIDLWSFSWSTHSSNSLWTLFMESGSFKGIFCGIIFPGSISDISFRSVPWQLKDFVVGYKVAFNDLMVSWKVLRVLSRH